MPTCALASALSEHWRKVLLPSRMSCAVTPTNPRPFVACGEHVAVVAAALDGDGSARAMPTMSSRTAATSALRPCARVATRGRVTTVADARARSLHAHRYARAATSGANHGVET